MPKKFAGENSKAVAARARKTAAKEQEESKRAKQLEEELWKDDDKHILKKQQKKEEQARKKQEILAKKAESKALLEEEVSSIKPPTKQPISKITQFQIQAENTKRQAAAGGKVKEPVTHIEKPLEENVNRLQVEGDEARTIDEAIAVLTVGEPEVDKHPEKRMKAAYTAFEEANLPRIKSENPSLRLTQLKQILHKEWLKSPENPMNRKLSS
ncbi:coiled-coil domain-containing protein 124 [Bacillus rossius redtenbacheri]|uniref:coiled-coil domain-containing protein 124 n=1 Tax=Bacillus rossius redtenbacheri TaxID=93214 RepID=UPI002FDEFAC8